MSKEREYEELYDRLLREVSTLHRNNRRRIRIGMKMLVAVTVGLMLLMFLSQGNKIFSLMLWIFSMFAVAAYLIAVECADYELQKKLEYITQMQQQSMGALLMLPELPEKPTCTRRSGRPSRRWSCSRPSPPGRRKRPVCSSSSMTCRRWMTWWIPLTPPPSAGRCWRP